jgi:hypothetical protein
VSPPKRLPPSFVSRHNQLKNAHETLLADVEEKDFELQQLNLQLEKLKNELVEHENQYAEQSKCSHELEARLCKENIALAEWWAFLFD